MASPNPSRNAVWTPACCARRAVQAKRAADVEAAKRREEDAKRGRELAALQAQREIERLRLEEARRKLELVRWSTVLHAALCAAFSIKKIK